MNTLVELLLWHKGDCFFVCNGNIYILAPTGFWYQLTGKSKNKETALTLLQEYVRQAEIAEQQENGTWTPEEPVASLNTKDMREVLSILTLLPVQTDLRMHNVAKDLDKKPSNSRWVESIASHSPEGLNKHLLVPLKTGGAYSIPERRVLDETELAGKYHLVPDGSFATYDADWNSDEMPEALTAYTAIQKTDFWDFARICASLLAAGADKRIPFWVNENDNAGKSTSIGLICNALGSATAVSLQAMDAFSEQGKRFPIHSKALASKLLVFLDECQNASKKPLTGGDFNFLTDDTLRVEDKGVDAIFLNRKGNTFLVGNGLPEISPPFDGIKARLTMGMETNIPTFSDEQGKIGSAVRNCADSQRWMSNWLLREASFFYSVDGRGFSDEKYAQLRGVAKELVEQSISGEIACLMRYFEKTQNASDKVPTECVAAVMWEHGLLDAKQAKQAKLIKQVKVISPKSTNKQVTENSVRMQVFTFLKVKANMEKALMQVVINLREEQNG